MFLFFKKNTFAAALTFWVSIFCPLAWSPFANNNSFPAHSGDQFIGFSPSPAVDFLAQNTKDQTMENDVGGEIQTDNSSEIVIIQTHNPIGKNVRRLNKDLLIMVVSFEPIRSIAVNGKKMELRKYDGYLIEFSIPYDVKNTSPTIDVYVQTDTSSKRKTLTFEEPKYKKKYFESTFFALLQMGYKQEDNVRHINPNNDGNTVASYHVLGFVSYVYGGLSSIYLDATYYKNQYPRDSIPEEDRDAYEAAIDPNDAENVSFSIAYRRKGITEKGMFDLGYSYTQSTGELYKKNNTNPDKENKYYLHYRDRFNKAFSLSVRTNLATLESEYRKGSNDEKSGNTTQFNVKAGYHNYPFSLTLRYARLNKAAKGLYVDRSDNTYGLGLSYNIVKRLRTGYSYTLKKSTYANKNPTYGIAPEITKNIQKLSGIYSLTNNFNVALQYENHVSSGNVNSFEYTNNLWGVVFTYSY